MNEKIASPCYCAGKWIRFILKPLFFTGAIIYGLLNLLLSISSIWSELFNIKIKLLLTLTEKINIT